MDGSAPVVVSALPFDGTLADAFADSVRADCVAAPVGRLTTRVLRPVVGAFASGQHGMPRVPGVRSEGYALGQNSAEILHNSDI